VFFEISEISLKTKNSITEISEISLDLILHLTV
jgi:hypothetical protein